LVGGVVENEHDLQLAVAGVLDIVAIALPYVANIGRGELVGASAAVAAEYRYPPAALEIKLPLRGVRVPMQLRACRPCCGAELPSFRYPLGSKPTKAFDGGMAKGVPPAIASALYSEPPMATPPMRFASSTIPTLASSPTEVRGLRGFGPAPHTKPLERPLGAPLCGRNAKKGLLGGRPSLERRCGELSTHAK